MSSSGRRQHRGPQRHAPENASPTDLHSPVSDVDNTPMTAPDNEALGRPVGSAGVVMGEDLGAPRRERLAKRTNLGDLVGGAADGRLVEQRRGVGRSVSEIHVAHR